MIVITTIGDAPMPKTRTLFALAGVVLCLFLLVALSYCAAQPSAHRSPDWSEVDEAHPGRHVVNGKAVK